MQKVRDLMTSNPETCELHHPITCAAEIMKKNNCGAIPLVDKDKKLVGIITDRDIALCLLENPKAPNDIKVGDCIKAERRLLTATAEENLHEAVERMKKARIRRLPVVDKDMRCIGILSQADIVVQGENAREAVEFVQAISR